MCHTSYHLLTRDHAFDIKKSQYLACQLDPMYSTQQLGRGTPMYLGVKEFSVTMERNAKGIKKSVLHASVMDFKYRLKTSNKYNGHIISRSDAVQQEAIMNVDCYQKNEMSDMYHSNSDAMQVITTVETGFHATLPFVVKRLKMFPITSRKPAKTKMSKRLTMGRIIRMDTWEQICIPVIFPKNTLRFATGSDFSSLTMILPHPSEMDTIINHFRKLVPEHLVFTERTNRKEFLSGYKILFNDLMLQDEYPEFIREEEAKRADNPESPATLLEQTVQEITEV